MAQIELDGKTVDFRCTSYTLTVYEQEFIQDKNPKITGDLIADLFRSMKVSSDDIMDADENGNIVINLDYTMDNWNAEKRALWAMIRTDAEIRRDNGESVDDVPSYKTWDKSLMSFEPDMREISFAVCQEAQRGLFRAGAAASGKTSEAEQG